MLIKIPDLDCMKALDFCVQLQSIEPLEGEKYYFDFDSVHNCDPFPMLIVSREIRKKREELKRLECYAKNCDNSYAKYMKFYKACGIGLGDEVTVARGNHKYNCITKLSVEQLREEGLNSLDVIQEVIDKKAKSMARILSQGDKDFEKGLAFIIREIIRNIPEHSESDAIWYCAQYWPVYDLVELAIMDEGIGIRKSISENDCYCEQISNDVDAIRLSLQPGVSGTFRGDSMPHIKSEWDNSGYGLYMVSQLCAELDASFIIASGDSAIRVRKENGKVIQEVMKTCFHGTAIQIRMRPSRIKDYDAICKKILEAGEMQAKQSKGAIHVASKPSRGF